MKKLENLNVDDLDSDLLYSDNKKVFSIVDSGDTTRYLYIRNRNKSNNHIINNTNKWRMFQQKTKNLTRESYLWENSRSTFP